MQKLENNAKKLEEEINVLKKQKENLEQQLADPVIYANAQKAKSINAEIHLVEKIIAEKEKIWEDAYTLWMDAVDEK